MKLILLFSFFMIICCAVSAQIDTCPDQACQHTAKFWQTHSCFSDPAVNWPFGGGSSDSGTWASLIGFSAVDSCDLKFTQFALGTPITTCLTNFQGADFLLLDLEGSTNQTALLLQEFYRFVVNSLYTLQTNNGPCPVGPDGLPPGVPPSTKRLTVIETLILASLTQAISLNFLPVAEQAGPNCDFSLVNTTLISQSLAFWTELNDARLQCVEDFDCIPGDGCTQTQGFWKNHFPWPGTNTEDNLLCGVSWTDWLLLRRKSLPQFGNAQRILGRQWIAAELNELNGACIPAETDLDAAEQILNDNCGNIIHPSNYPTGQDMINLASDIGEFNEGLVGPGSCL